MTLYGKLDAPASIVLDLRNSAYNNINRTPRTSPYFGMCSGPVGDIFLYGEKTKSE